MDKLKDEVIFYGNGLIPLSVGCMDCYHFNNECYGSVHEEDCPVGKLTEIQSKNNRLVTSIWKDLNYNNALLYLLLETGSRHDLKEHIQDLFNKISYKFKENNIVLSTELFLDIMENEDHQILSTLNSGSGYIESNLNTLRDIEKVLKYTDEYIDNLRKKYNQ